MGETPAAPNIAQYSQGSGAGGVTSSVLEREGLLLSSVEQALTELEDAASQVSDLTKAEQAEAELLELLEHKQRIDKGAEQCLPGQDLIISAATDVLDWRMMSDAQRRADAEFVAESLSRHYGSSAPPPPPVSLQACQDRLWLDQSQQRQAATTKELTRAAAAPALQPAAPRIMAPPGPRNHDARDSHEPTSEANYSDQIQAKLAAWRKTLTKELVKLSTPPSTHTPSQFGRPSALSAILKSTSKDQRQELLCMLASSSSDHNTGLSLVNDKELWKASAALRKSLVKEREYVLGPTRNSR
eukprot:TRINITY_DN44484_c0_g2_i1.p1 TRINITY_DN44484_c0_g2~~TRINITY_DN44484_c0_g2_i1.p1  ORF type:complete len:300 (-),score=41.78 TRINITY_DN44484_c0_g2_i1:321-1220(-)